MPKVSIIIPCYNMGALLEETLDSVKTQTFTDYETILINDGSTDAETIKILETVEVPQGRCLHIENRGLPGARNHGIREAKGEYILPLDSDDKIHADYLMETVELLDADAQEELGFVTTDYRFFEEQDIAGIPKDYDPIALAVENCIPVTSLFRKKCWEAVGGYEESLKGYQDWNLWIQIVAKGWKWKVVRKELFYYRDRKGSMLKGSDRRRGELAAQIMDLNQEFYQQNATAILKESAAMIGGLRAKSRDLKVEREMFYQQLKRFRKNPWFWLGKKLGLLNE